MIVKQIEIEKMIDSLGKQKKEISDKNDIIEKLLAENKDLRKLLNCKESETEGAK